MRWVRFWCSTADIFTAETDNRQVYRKRGAQERRPAFCAVFERNAVIGEAPLFPAPRWALDGNAPPLLHPGGSGDDAGGSQGDAEGTRGTGATITKTVAARLSHYGADPSSLCYSTA
jgi:hypothetical protein